LKKTNGTLDKVVQFTTGITTLPANILAGEVFTAGTDLPFAGIY
jgi:hypothetical protein